MQGPHSDDRMQQWRADMLIAIAFLTRLPVYARERLEAGHLIHALRLSPAIGAFIGAFIGSFYWLALSFGFSAFIAEVIGIIAAATFTCSDLGPK